MLTTLLIIAFSNTSITLHAQAKKSKKQLEADVLEAQSYWSTLSKSADECVSEIQLIEKVGKKCSAAMEILEKRDAMTRMVPENASQISYIVGVRRARKFIAVKDRANQDVSKMEKYIDWVNDRSDRKKK